ncbi:MULTISPECIES: MarR family winged helix-turn-helix transcriptional regulator [unclassified Bradyrhizobium]|uniref:MarR family winged helix-turn-helix transcriptional regulator n=1 Tax=unclassified Bradyrhizobium TaxID=2631580 RepID=UPI001BA4AB29|nr:MULTISPECIES: MarR family winged helix-turn-helix transcriptional regulator [unclassified Bradyrhizobium]MBR1223917.1 MarR family transcriptional regulator [Bradyrhizobium sp. AUGA SZCCT0176]MBR1233557.1 MarR family transcriptional regulator [Bradyrhizobium sp. AUGA SZCCT0182]MBR1283386.1 MarR family transcriptional regulator [Bradyrhizobium sp. AUGA SZCCT0177]MBR1298345.1 MarR family transcriptional regulator [Bradyrhizobium sp. AUGA SZCCT0042]
MRSKPHTPAGQALTGLILAIFRLNGRLLLAGDRLVAGLELTSARWQVLGAIALAERPQPVAWLARNMGLNRQGVQRIVNEMRDEGLLELQPNPHHRRAHLVVLTKRGKEAFEAATKLQVPWVNALAEGVSLKDLATTQRVVAELCERLEAGLNDDASENT